MAADPPGLDAKLAFLRLSTSFPEAAYRVEAMETHMSWVFLLDEVVYKLKKPVCDDCLDFSTLEAREFNCKEELRLNRRLAPAVYLGIVSLNLDADGHLGLGGPGQVVDWLVRMRRLPERRMLDSLIAHGALDDGDIARVAATLAAFYSRLRPERPDPEAFRERLRRHIEADAAGLAAVASSLPPSLIGAVAGAQLAALVRLRDTFDARLRDGHIVEGHGDLRPEHVCLGRTVEIIDCLEFARDLRILDVADEVAYLALECERLGAPAAGASLLDWYAQCSGDRPQPDLVSFYKSYRCLSRAHLALRHLQEPQLRHSAHWTLRAHDYMRLAKSHIDTIPRRRRARAARTSDPINIHGGAHDV